MLPRDDMEFQAECEGAVPPKPPYPDDPRRLCSRLLVNLAVLGPETIASLASLTFIEILEWLSRHGGGVSMLFPCLPCRPMQVPVTDVPSRLELLRRPWVRFPLFRRGGLFR
jgi:hypothetical protein